MQSNRRGSETANEEQPDKLTKTIRIEHGAPASGEKHDRHRPVLVQNSGHVDDDIQISALDLLDDALFGNSKRVSNAGSPSCLVTRRR